MTNERITASQDELQIAQHAADALVQVFNMALNAGYDSRKAWIDGLVAAIHQHESVIQARVDFDGDGILSFQFFEIREGQEPRPIIDALPKRNLN